MKNTYLSCFTVLFLLSSSLSFADSSQRMITLKDGSTIKGAVTKMENGVYTVVSDQLGEIEINDQNIINIQTFNANAVADHSNTANTATAEPSELKNQVQAMQGQILNDPEMMKEIMGLVEDPEIHKLLSDENFVNQVMSMDQKKLENNDQVNDLMDNPKMREMMEKIQARMATQGAQP